jgi:polysaccharide deacetylase 2 family uncharacterized protein YibQ
MAASGMSRKGKRPERRFPGLMWTTIALGMTGAIIALLYLLPLPPTKTHPPFEDFRHVPSLPPRPSRPKAKVSPMVAILIDDMGYSIRMDNALLDLNAPLSFSFLPGAPHTPMMARKARHMGRDVLVHLPLEPLNPRINPGPGSLRLDMDPDTMLTILRRDLDAVPGAIGVNNHMGSKFTANRKAMRFILTEIKSRHPFFIDSRTTKDSVAYTTAMSMGIPTAERAVFLDHDPRQEAIRKEIKRLVRLSIKRGCVLAIGHPMPNTWKVLQEELPKINREVKLVPVHRILVSSQ